MSLDSVIQDDLDTLCVEVEAGPAFDREARETVTRNLRAVVGPEMAITILQVASIAVDPTRKFKAVSSKVGKRD